MIRPHKLLVLLLLVGSVGCGKNVTGPNGTNVWAEVASPGTGLVRSMAVIGTNLFAGSNGGVFRSTDNGASWTALTHGLPVYQLVANGTSLFAVTASQGYADGVYGSADSGVTWVPANHGLTQLAIHRLVVSGTNLFVAGGGTSISPDAGGVFRSTDNGASWTAVNNGLDTTDVSGLAVSGTSLWAATGLGLYRSTDDGENWTAVNPGTRLGIRIVLGGSSTSLFVASDTCQAMPSTCYPQMYRSANNGASWTMVSDLPLWVAFASGTSLFATSFVGVHRSTDDGASWAQFNDGLPPLPNVTAAAAIGTNLFASGTYSDWSAGITRPALWRRSL